MSSTNRQPKRSGFLKKLMSADGLPCRQKIVGTGTFGKVYLYAMIKETGEGDNLPEAPTTDTPPEQIRTFVVKEVDLRNRSEKMKDSLREEVRIIKHFEKSKYFVRVEEDIAAEEVEVDRFYYAMEYCNYGSLRDVVQSTELRFNEARCQNLFYQLLKGLHVMNKHSYLHRDLKPENILIHGPNLDEATLKIADFGFAKQYIHADEMNLITQFLQTACGTRGYFAPERWKVDVNSKSKYGFRAELYTAGMILFEMITGKHYFQNMEYEGFHQRIQHYVPWPDARHLLSLLLQEDPAQRCTVRQALAHPWLARTAEVANADRLLVSRIQGAAIKSFLSAVMCPRCNLAPGCRETLLLQLGELGKKNRTAAQNEEWDQLVSCCLMPMVPYTDRLAEQGFATERNSNTPFYAAGDSPDSSPFESNSSASPSPDPSPKAKVTFAPEKVEFTSIHNFLWHHMEMHQLDYALARLDSFKSTDPSVLLETLQLIQAIDPSELNGEQRQCRGWAMEDVTKSLQQCVSFSRHLKIALVILTQIAEGSATRFGEPRQEGRTLVSQTTLVWQNGQWKPDPQAKARYPYTADEMAHFACCLLEPVGKGEAMVERCKKEGKLLPPTIPAGLQRDLYEIIVRLVAARTEEKNDGDDGNHPNKSYDKERLAAAFQELTRLEDPVFVSATKRKVPNQ